MMLHHGSVHAGLASVIWARGVTPARHLRLLSVRLAPDIGLGRSNPRSFRIGLRNLGPEAPHPRKGGGTSVDHFLTRPFRDKTIS
jgi:hypothetical protein